MAAYPRAHRFGRRRTRYFVSNVDPPRQMKRFTGQRRQHRMRPNRNSIALPAHFASPVAARSTSPRSSRAILASVRFVIADKGSSFAMSPFFAYSSRCLISSHDGLLGLRPKARIRTSTHVATRPSAYLWLRESQGSMSIWTANISLLHHRSHSVGIPSPSRTAATRIRSSASAVADGRLRKPTWMLTWRIERAL